MSQVITMWCGARLSEKRTVLSLTNIIHSAAANMKKKSILHSNSIIGLDSVLYLSFVPSIGNENQYLSLGSSSATI